MKLPVLSFISLLLTQLISAQSKSVIHPFETFLMPLERTSPAISTLIPKEYPFIAENEEDEITPNNSLKNQMRSVNPNALPKGKDVALQEVYGNFSKPSSAAVQILSNWQGLNDLNVSPSDNTLAVGPNHVMQMINGGSTLLRIWDKHTGAVLVNNGQVGDIIGGANLGDPNIIYDAEADRFVFLVIGGSLGGGNLTVCVSKTADPTGAYYIYKAPGGSIFSPNFPDYPKMGVWGNAYYVTTNSSGPYIWAFDRTSMLAGEPGAKAQKFKLSDFPGGGVQTTSPVTFTGTLAPPENSPAVIMRVFDDAWTTGSDLDNLELFFMKIDWEDALNSTISGPLKIDVGAYDSKLCNSDLNAGTCIPQKGTGQKLDALGGIIMDKSQYLNFGTYESIVCTHLCDARGDAVAGSRWYELRRSGENDWTVFQQGTYAPEDGAHRFLSSITQNTAGTMAMGFNVSGNTIFPGIRVTGRLAEDEAGIMTAEEAIVKIGDAAQTSSNRYGDYNGMVSDPSDGSFWFTANYNPTKNWNTNVVHFTIDNKILPVNFISFSVFKNEENQAELTWKTTNEINNNYFEVLRSIDGVNFSVVGKVLANNNAGNINTYSFKDIQSANGTVFYKLKQVDKDEKFTFSNIQKINITLLENSLSVWPNPAGNYIDISFRSIASDIIPIQMVDYTGKIFKELSIKSIVGTNKTRINISSVPEGYYIIKCHVNGIVMVQKIIVNK